MRISQQLLCITGFLLFITKCSAADVFAWTDQADIVCIASVVSEQRSNEKLPILTEMPYITTLNTLQVQKFLKGTLPTRKIVVKSYPLDMKAMRQQGITTWGGNLLFKGFKVKQNYLIFAKKDAGADTYSLVEDHGYGSTIEVGPISAEVSSQQPVLTNILLQLISTISSTNSQNQMASLEALQDFGPLLWQKIPPTEGLVANEVGKITNKSDLIGLLMMRAVPALLALGRNGNQNIRVYALVAAAHLQSTEAIPELAALVSTNPDLKEVAAASLQSYHTSDAVPSLVPLLKNNDTDVRTSALISLRAIRDSRSLPYVLEALTDSDEKVRYLAAYVCYELTGQMPPPAVSNFPAKQQDYAKYWTDWAIKHKAELDKSRLQLNASGKVLDIPKQ